MMVHWQLILRGEFVPNQSHWKIELKDAGDSSGDVYIELPRELLTQFDWRIGDTFIVELCEDGGLHLTKAK